MCGPEAPMRPFLAVAHSRRISTCLHHTSSLLSLLLSTDFPPRTRLVPFVGFLVCKEKLRAMATMSVDRICSSSYGAMASTVPRAAAVAHVSGAASSTVSLAGCGSRRSSAGALVAENTRLGGRRAGVARSRSFSLVCRSSVKPLADSSGSGNVVEFQSEDEFNTILTDAGDKLVVVDISTTTCGPCKMIFPKLVEMSLQYPDAVFVKINGDVNNDTRTLMRKWGVRAVPNFRFFKKGEQVHSHTGAKLDELKARFAEHYGQPIKV